MSISFTLGLDVRYALASDGLSVTISATNLGSQPLPYGAVCHPYLTVGTALVDGATPMTCPPNAFRTGTDLIVLDPGQQHVATWGISPSGT
jgi:galactose mutarotase-like enzyme